eukprot:TRINITY_DN12966_c0_g1_i1.p1 TRINITY_DN12966_c0_g1~~TRINITY_DN12966_c0_g1_i1.p1  ORF type:complete len:619 (+),score=120.09 TRINITY_DN12966_c0_g1_i1:71-1858(+)
MGQSIDSHLAIMWIKNEPILHIVLAEKARFTKVSAGWRHLLALKDDGNIYTFGNGLYLGRQDRNSQLYFSLPIEGFDDVIFTDISAGETHSMAIYSTFSMPWNYKEQLKTEADWDVIGYGHNPPRKLELTQLTLLKTAVGDEYKKAKHLFENNLHGTNFTIKNIFAIDNHNLETAFLSEISKLTHKWKESPSLFKKDDWRRKRIQNNDNKNSNTKLQYREEVWNQLSDIIKSYDWNKKRDIPVIPVCHGTTEEAVWNICKSGFSSLAKLDEGLYGRGMYFTTHVPYAASYSLKMEKKDSIKIDNKKPTDEDKHDKESKKEENKKEVKPMVFIISFAIPGSIYPVIEHPYKRGSLKGKPNHAGYQSHYVKVNNNGLPSRRQGKTYDELVLFQESQVLPRYVIYATPGKEKEENTDILTQPTEVNRITFTDLVIRTKEILSDSSFSNHLGYMDKRTVNRCVKDAELWLTKNPHEEEVLNLYKHFIKVVSIINNTNNIIIANANKEEEEKQAAQISDEEDYEEDEEEVEDEGKGELNEEDANTIWEGSPFLLEELKKLREQNKRLQEENDKLKQKIKWMEILDINNHKIKPPRCKKIT